MEERKCLECGQVVMGRSDKKFCSDACRNAYNNKQLSPQYNNVRNVNNVLARNRRILEKLNASGKTKTHRDKLVREGFDFNFITSNYETKNGDVYRFCYEQGYLDIGNGFLLLVKRED